MFKEKLTPEERAAVKKFVKGKPVEVSTTREKNLYIRVSEEEKQHIETLARAAKLSVSEFIRKCAMNVKINALPPNAFFRLANELQELESKLPQVRTQSVTPQFLQAFLKRFENAVLVFERTVYLFYNNDPSCQELVRSLVEAEKAEKKDSNDSKSFTTEVRRYDRS